MLRQLTIKGMATDVFSRAYKWIVLTSLALVPFIYLPEFYEPYSTPKRIFLLVAAMLSIAIHFIQALKSTKPTLPASVSSYFFICWTLAGFQLFVHGVSPLNEVFADLILAGVFVLNSWSSFRKGVVNFQSLHMSVLAGGICCGVIWILKIIERGDVDPTPFFGNRNLLSQYLGITLLSGLYVFGKSLRELRFQMLLFSLLVMMVITLAALASSKSVLLALLTGAAILVAHTYGRWNKTKLSFLIATILIVCTVPLWLGNSSLISRDPSYFMRLELLGSAFTLIKSRPLLGIGWQSFETQSLPILAPTQFGLLGSQLHRTPHNEFLRLILEHGLPVGVAIILSLGILLHRLIRSSSNGVDRIYLLALASFLFIESLFQFPLLLSYFSVYLGCVIGGYLSRIEQKPCQRAYGLSLCALTFVFFAIFIPKLYASQKLPTSESEAKRACMALADKWRGCVNYINILLDLGDLPLAKKVLAERLETDPHRPAYLESGVKLAWLYGNERVACELHSHLLPLIPTNHPFLKIPTKCKPAISHRNLRYNRLSTLIKHISN